MGESLNVLITVKNLKFLASLDVEYENEGYCALVQLLAHVTKKSHAIRNPNIRPRYSHVFAWEWFEVILRHCWCFLLICNGDKKKWKKKKTLQLVVGMYSLQVMGIWIGCDMKATVLWKRYSHTSVLFSNSLWLSFSFYAWISISLEKIACSYNRTSMNQKQPSMTTPRPSNLAWFHARPLHSLWRNGL